jgi:O-antigen ligase
MCFIALVLSGSRTHFIALLAFLGILCLLRIWGPSRGLLKSALGLIVASAILVGAFLAGPEYARNRLLMKHSSRNTAEERLAFADTQRALALNFAVQRPLFGIGLGQFVEHPTTGSYYADAHDTVSVLLGETGFLGTLTFLPILFFALFQSARWMVRHSRLKNMDDYYFGLVMLAILGSMILAGLGGYVIVYQRLFWLVVGLSATLARAAMPTSRPVRDARPLPPHDSARPVEAPGPA